MLSSKKVSPTEKELEILQVLWSHDSASVRDVHEKLASKKVGYTTTLKLMQLMHEKGYVTRKREGRLHTYYPAIKKEETQTNLLGKFVDSVFQGSTFNLISHAIENSRTSKKEWKEIKELLENLEGLSVN